MLTLNHKVCLKGEMQMKYYIEYGYDRHYTSWVTIVFDEDGNQVDCEYDGNKISRDYSIKIFKDEYNTNDVRKIKAY